MAEIGEMIIAAQLKAARALMGIARRRLAEASRLSLPTLQQMESSDRTIGGNLGSLVKLIDALNGLGIELTTTARSGESWVRRAVGVMNRSGAVIPRRRRFPNPGRCAA